MKEASFVLLIGYRLKGSAGASAAPVLFLSHRMKQSIEAAPFYFSTLLLASSM